MTGQLKLLLGCSSTEGHREMRKHIYAIRITFQNKRHESLTTIVVQTTFHSDKSKKNICTKSYLWLTLSVPAASNMTKTDVHSISFPIFLLYALVFADLVADVDIGGMLPSLPFVELYFSSIPFLDRVNSVMMHPCSPRSCTVWCNMDIVTCAPCTVSKITYRSWMVLQAMKTWQNNVSHNEKMKHWQQITRSKSKTEAWGLKLIQEVDSL